MPSFAGFSGSSRKAAVSAAFEKAVVIEVNLTPLSISTSDIDIPIGNERIPRNSIIARRIGDVAGSPICVCYPFFSSHLQLPIKAGETVWVFFDSNIKTIGYWVSRVHGDAFAEDVNYSHFDRGLLNPAEDSQTIGLAEKAGKAEMPTYEDFPNNSMTQTDNSASEEGSTEDLPSTVDEYENIFLGSSANKTLALEPVPRISRRAGDTVIQGSNNTAIILGTKRGRLKEEEDFTQSDSGKPPQRNAGTIDIVAGRGFTTETANQRRTSYTTYVNTRGFTESLKDETRRNLEQNPSEGDPDFYDDAARIYVSMSCIADTEFSLSDSLPYSFEFEEEAKALDPSPTATIVMKSDNIRMIARKDEETERVNGSIKIVKEGMSSEDAASIMLLPSGLIQITGSKVILGKHASDGGADDGPEGDDNVNKLQPYVKYQQLEDLLKAIMADIKSFCDTLSTHTTPGYGAPSPQINQAASSLKSAMDSREGEIVNLKSLRIFGE